METTGVGGNDPVYRKDMQKGVQIFEKTFKEMEKTKNFPQKKQELEKAADDSLRALHDAAKGLKDKRLEEMEKKLDEDFHSYLENPSAQSESQVQKDIDALRDEVK